MLKYTPEDLIEFYINGSMPPDARIEFVRLMRQDPLFADKVAQVLERLDAEPGSMDMEEEREDRKGAGAWRSAGSSFFRPSFKNIALWALVLLIATGLGWTLNRVIPLLNTVLYSAFHLSETQSSGSVTQTADAGNGKRVPAILAKPKLGQAQKDATKAPTKAPEPTATPVPTAAVGSVPDAGPKPLEVVTEKTEKVTITVQDSGGQVVRTLYKGMWLAGKHYLLFDGKNDLFQKVPSGDYTIVVAGEETNSSNVINVP